MPSKPLLLWISFHFVSCARQLSHVSSAGSSRVFVSLMSVASLAVSAANCRAAAIAADSSFKAPPSMPSSCDCIVSARVHRSGSSGSREESTSTSFGSKRFNSVQSDRPVAESDTLELASAVSVAITRSACYSVVAT
eukprot:scaffold1661_cov251-Pinguiococcus_pyrenoidosus.AAC.35